MYPSFTEEDEKRERERVKHLESQKLRDPTLFEGVGDQILYTPARMVESLVSFALPDDYKSRYRHDPETQGTIAGLIDQMSVLAAYIAPANVGKYLGAGVTAMKYIRAGGLANMATSMGAETRRDSLQRGEDPTTALLMGIIGGAGGTAQMMFTPYLPVKSALGKLASGAVTAPIAGVTTAKLQAKVLHDGGYHDMANQVSNYSKGAMALDMATNVLAVALTHKNILHESGQEIKAIAPETFKKVGDVSTDVIQNTKGGADVVSQKAKDIYNYVIQEVTDLYHNGVMEKKAKGTPENLIPTHPKAEQAHAELYMEGLKAVEKGEIPKPNEAHLQTIAENSIENPHYKPYELPDELKQQPVKEALHEADTLAPKETAPKETAPKETAVKELVKEGSAPLKEEPAVPKNEFSSVDEHASYRLAELEKSHPEIAKELKEFSNQEIKALEKIQKTDLFQKLVDCYLENGGGL